eukprot:TRINITY_DN848_c0_g1_i1.p1 TRINITY_DN848_c0_g1~~TRINITY_DN848_c0_g1_i1.p1  ORF type:complete len:295 (+),score=41.19 TRINITY_DN848_c0_g1_i1:359-1243(+)
MVATASDDTNVNLWDTRTNHITKTFKGHTNYVMSVNFHPSGNLIASGSFDNTAIIWDVNTGTVKHRIEAHETVVSVHFNPEGTNLVTAGFDGLVKVWDVESGSLLQNFAVNQHTQLPVCFAKWSPNGRYILAGSFDGTWKLINAGTGNAARLYTGHSFNDYCIFAAFSLTRGKYIISGSADNSVCIWDINSGELLQKMEGHQDVVVAVDSHPTVDMIASGALDSDNTVRLWKQHEVVPDPPQHYLEDPGDQEAQEQDDYHDRTEHHIQYQQHDYDRDFSSVPSTPEASSDDSSE